MLEIVVYTIIIQSTTVYTTQYCSLSDNNAYSYAHFLPYTYGTYVRTYVRTVHSYTVYVYSYLTRIELYACMHTMVYTTPLLNNILLLCMPIINYFTCHISQNLLQSSYFARSMYQCLYGLRMCIHVGQYLAIYITHTVVYGQ